MVTSYMYDQAICGYFQRHDQTDVSGNNQQTILEDPFLYYIFPEPSAEAGYIEDEGPRTKMPHGDGAVAYSHYLGQRHRLDRIRYGQYKVDRQQRYPVA